MKTITTSQTGRKSRLSATDIRLLLALAFMLMLSAFA